MNTLNNVILAASLTIASYTQSTEVVKERLNKYDAVREKIEKVPVPEKIYLDGKVILEFPNYENTYAQLKEFIYSTKSDSIKFTSLDDSLFVARDDSTLKLPSNLELDFIVRELKSTP